ncbi:PEP-CTERM sorting domain-containing protein [Roseateles albus]|uniref:PEP-CTERM sorting domain-containing protein n=1 Tax=Roseateles albus TaxID=2987525 RepID=A0ABT5KCX7_9BURK|nr:PEP-CTERM sorting domain-containing protein [Roseateles albus]MDC8771776.1 PEP-CTERM sorting domain-containing protein [Roseateles albus]
MMKKSLKTAALLGAMSLVGAVQAAGVPGQGTWETTLQVRDLDGNIANGPEAFYDTALNVTWLRAGSTGTMDWGTAKAWAEQDRFGLSGWRLPTTHVTSADGSCVWSYTGGTSCGYNPDSSISTGSEMAHLFFQSLGNKSYYVPGTTNVQAGNGLTNTGNFQNLQSKFYWSGTEYAPYSFNAWFFITIDGSQSYYEKTYSLNALAVRPGDVAAAVPEPQTWALILLGLTGVLLARRRRAL